MSEKVTIAMTNYANALQRRVAAKEAMETCLAEDTASQKELSVAKDVLHELELTLTEHVKPATYCE